MAKSENESDIADQAYDLGDMVDNFVDERPLTALAIAVVIGALFARHFFSSRTDDSADHSAIAPDGRATDFLENLHRRIA